LVNSLADNPPDHYFFSTLYVAQFYAEIHASTLFLNRQTKPMKYPNDVCSGKWVWIFYGCALKCHCGVQAYDPTETNSTNT